jgi:mannosyltransferase
MSAVALGTGTDDQGAHSAARDPESPTGNTALSKLVRLVWLWPALAALLLGVYHLGRPELWRDELATWDAASGSSGQLFDLLGHTDASSGAYYLFLHGWISVFGDSVASLRIPSVLAMVAAAALTALVAKRMFGDRAALCAGLVFALVPAVSRFAQEARSYALTVFAVALVTLLLLRALERPGLVRWIVYAVGVTLVGVLNLVALTFLLGHLVVVAMHWWRERDRRVLLGFPVAALAGIALLTPIVVLGLRQAGIQFQIPTPSLSDVFTSWPQLFFSALVAGAVTFAAPLALGASRSQGINGLAMATLPIAAVWIVSHGATSYWMPRYLMFTLPAWALVAGAGIAMLRPAAATIALVVLALLGVPDQRQLRTPDAHDWWSYPSSPASPPFSYAGAAAVIAQGYRPGDGVVPVRQVAGYYMIDTGLRYYLPLGIQPRDVFAARTGTELGSFFTQDTTDPRAALGNVRRLWLVRVGQPADPLQGLPSGEAQVLRDNFMVTQVAHPSGYATVALLDRKPVPGP